MVTGEVMQWISNGSLFSTSLITKNFSKQSCNVCIEGDLLVVMDKCVIMMSLLGYNVTCKCSFLPGQIAQGGPLVFQAGYHPRKRTFKTHPNRIFFSMKIDPKYASLHAFFLVCPLGLCPFQN